MLNTASVPVVIFLTTSYLYCNRSNKPNMPSTEMMRRASMVANGSPNQPVENTYTSKASTPIIFSTADVMNVMPMSMRAICLATAGMINMVRSLRFW